MGLFIGGIAGAFRPLPGTRFLMFPFGKGDLYASIDANIYYGGMGGYTAQLLKVLPDVALTKAGKQLWHYLPA